jgi:hypothetical protein
MLRLARSCACCWLVTAAVLGASGAHAFQADDRDTALAIELPAAQWALIMDGERLIGDAAARRYGVELIAALGPGWQVTAWNPNTGTPRPCATSTTSGKGRVMPWCNPAR